MAVQKTYYLLLSGEYEDEATAEVFAYGDYVNGGSGYLWAHGGKNYTVLSCYLSQSGAEEVQTLLNRQNISTEIYPIAVSYFVLRTPADLEDKELLSSSVSVIDGVLQTLYYTANSIEKGEFTQLQARSALAECKSLLSGLSAEQSAGVKYSAIASMAQNSIEELERLEDRIVYARDIRYVLVSLCVDFCALGEIYA